MVRTGEREPGPARSGDQSATTCPALSSGRSSSPRLGYGSPVNKFDDRPEAPLAKGTLGRYQGAMASLSERLTDSK